MVRACAVRAEYCNLIVLLLCQIRPSPCPSTPGCICRCVDPLDGTTNFAHGYPSFAVSVAGKHALLCILLVFVLKNVDVSSAAHVLHATDTTAK